MIVPFVVSVTLIYESVSPSVSDPIPRSKVIGVSSLVATACGSTRVGASLIALTVILTVAVEESKSPSLTLKVNESLPL